MPLVALKHHKRMQIDYLARHKALIPAVSKLVLPDWEDFYGDITWKDVTEIFYERLNDNKIPLALIAFEGSQVFGTVSLLEESISTRKHLTPWIAGLYVCEEKRHCGIGMQLIEAAAHEARRLGTERLYIGIRKAEDHYTKLGWQTIERTIYHDEEIIIMRLDL
jgi:GNAT superfamily N-acetyltransferase